MEMLTSTILSNILWKLIKNGSILTVKNLKDAMKKWVLRDPGYEIIASEVNNAPSECKSSQESLGNYVTNNEQIKNVIESDEIGNVNIMFKNNDIKGTVNNAKIDNQKNIFKF